MLQKTRPPTLPVNSMCKYESTWNDSANTTMNPDDFSPKDWLSMDAEILPEAFLRTGLSGTCAPGALVSPLSQGSRQHTQNSQQHGEGRERVYKPFYPSPTGDSGLTEEWLNEQRDKSQAIGNVNMDIFDAKSTKENLITTSDSKYGESTNPSSSYISPTGFNNKHAQQTQNRHFLPKICHNSKKFLPPDDNTLLRSHSSQLSQSMFFDSYNNLHSDSSVANISLRRSLSAQVADRMQLLYLDMGLPEFTMRSNSNADINSMLANAEDHDEKQMSMLSRTYSETGGRSNRNQRRGSSSNRNWIAIGDGHIPQKQHYITDSEESTVVSLQHQRSHNRSNSQGMKKSYHEIYAKDDWPALCMHNSQYMNSKTNETWGRVHSDDHEHYGKALLESFPSLRRVCSTTGKGRFEQYDSMDAGNTNSHHSFTVMPDHLEHFSLYGNNGHGNGHRENSDHYAGSELATTHSTPLLPTYSSSKVSSVNRNTTQQLQQHTQQQQGQQQQLLEDENKVARTKLSTINVQKQSSSTLSFSKSILGKYAKTRAEASGRKMSSHSHIASRLTKSGFTNSTTRKNRIIDANVKKVGSQELLMCTNCSTSNTCLWRSSEQGLRLCNACGLYYKAKNKHRPENLFNKKKLTSRTENHTVTRTPKENSVGKYDAMSRSGVSSVFSNLSSSVENTSPTPKTVPKLSDYHITSSASLTGSPASIPLSRLDITELSSTLKVELPRDKLE
eukprot:CFRG2243T1